MNPTLQKGILPCVLFCLGIVHIDAARPPATFAKSKQLDIDRLEKTIGVKFSTAFPDHRFDIDYFYKGDLAHIRVGRQEVYVTCPYVVGPMIAFAIGTGTDSGSYAQVADVSMDLDKSGKVTRVSIHHDKLKQWPKSNKVPIRKDKESKEDYLKRSTRFWMVVAGKISNPPLAKHQVSAALILVGACLEQAEAGREKAKKAVPAR